MKEGQFDSSQQGMTICAPVVRVSATAMPTQCGIIFSFDWAGLPKERRVSRRGSMWLVLLLILGAFVAADALGDAYQEEHQH